MRLRRQLIVGLSVSLAFSACGLFDGETLYREPQSAMVASTSVTEDPTSAIQPYEPTPRRPVSPAEIAVDQSPAPEAFTLVVPHPDHGELPEVLAAHARVATEQGRRPFIEFSAEWCPPCQAIEASLGDPLMVDALEGVYLIRLDIDAWESELLRSDFRIPGIPLFYELDANGNSTGRAIAGSAWGQDIPRYMAPPLYAFFQNN